MYKLAGIPDIITAPNPDTGGNTPSQKPDTLLLRETLSIQFNAPMQAASVASLENKGNIVLNFLKQFASVERIGMIVGSINQTYIQSFKKDDIAKVHRVRTRSGNPLSQTAEGRLQLAMLYNTLGLTDPRVIAEVLETGTLQNLTAGPQQEMMAVKKEIEMLRAGQMPMILKTQNHLLAIKQLQSNILNDPKFVSGAATPGSQSPGNDAIVVQNTLLAIQQHIAYWKQISVEEPELVAAIGIPNIAAPAAPPPPGAGNKAAATPKTSSPQLNEAAHNQKPQ
jgi:hypothetical protein